MMRIYVRGIIAFVSVIILGLIVWAIIHGDAIAVLNPGGTIATQQKDLLVLATVLSALIVIPVFGMTYMIVRKYHEGSKNAKYEPNWDHDRRAELVWWGVPLILILILSGIIWVSSHTLDPYRPLTSDKKPLTVQVIALDWKWLFIYPEQDIASVNFLQIPIDTPINFQITSDAPMNSFWIPRLGGQVYAMSGMSTQLHLIANTAGTYTGRSANISGKGYAGMTFTVRAGSQAEFDAWIARVQARNNPLTVKRYDELARPSEKNPVVFYSSPPKELYDTVIMKYMMPMGEDVMEHRHE